MSMKLRYMATIRNDFIVLSFTYVYPNAWNYIFAIYGIKLLFSLELSPVSGSWLLSQGDMIKLKFAPNHYL